MLSQLVSRALLSGEVSLSLGVVDRSTFSAFDSSFDGHLLDAARAPHEPRARILGTPITAVTQDALLAMVTDAVDSRNPTVFVGLYAALFRLMRNSSYRDLVERSVTYPDGAGVVTELHKRGVSEAHRLATTDVVHPIAGLAAERGLRVGLYGGAVGVAQRAAATLTRRLPELKIAAVWDGYSGSPSIAELRDAELDILFVGIGAGKQEAWSHDVAVQAGVPAVLTCGGLFDFLAGDKRRAPQWVQRANLEWAFRAVLEPRRLVIRYMRGNSYFIWHARADRARTAELVQPSTPVLSTRFADRTLHPDLTAGTERRGFGHVAPGVAEDEPAATEVRAAALVCP